MQNYSVGQKGAVTTIKTEESEFRIFVTSDIHFDSAHCNRDQFFKDLDFAMNLGADIYINGDFFDAMQGRFDKRKDMDHLRPEYRREDYYDVIVNDAADQLAPYASKIMMMSDGNHELAVLKYANTNLLPRLLKALETKNHTILHGGYGGIINVQYDHTSCPLKYFHGSGGEAPVTKGAIQTNRQGVFLADFQVVLNGHSHNSYWIPLVRERVTDSGTHYFDIQHHVRTPGYKMDYGDGSVGWDVTRGGVPKPTGGALLHFSDSEVHVYPKIHAPIPISPIEDIYQGIIFPQE
jgi:hypothetical protein